MSSRIELDELDRARVERAREALTDVGAADVGVMTALELAGLIGRLEAHLSLVLDVCDRGDTP